MEPRAAYRSLSRLLKRHLGGAGNSRPWREFVAQEFRGAAAVSAAELDSRLQLATDYLSLVGSTHEHLALLLSYNIGIDHDARQRDTIRRSAASVGLQLPVAPDEEAGHQYGPDSGGIGQRAEQARHAYGSGSGPAGAR